MDAKLQQSSRAGFSAAHHAFTARDEGERDVHSCSPVSSGKTLHEPQIAGEGSAIGDPCVWIVHQAANTHVAWVDGRKGKFFCTCPTKKPLCQSLPLYFHHEQRLVLLTALRSFKGSADSNIRINPLDITIPSCKQQADTVRNQLTDKSNRPVANGHAPYGHAPYGHAPYGHAPNGHALYSHAPYAPAPYGHAPYDHAPNGHAPNDHAPYGHAPNGHAPYGHAPNGHAPNDHAPYCTSNKQQGLE
ncbi:Paternally-expressed gene 3 protein [Liparis tanakae]|uniref:Paternally-expressed gene 3 protein n=1 Tax=Liparis tanakae TaxID=230148 RepID=A0A4Z2IIN1_9TELE|nr:Paternally-expressed gene 3 protein [Liparis tanakae]